MPEIFLAVPLHFTVEFIGFLVMAGGAIQVLTRPSLIPGPLARRAVAAAGLATLCAAQVLHGSATIETDGNGVVVFMRAAGFLLLGVALAGLVRGGAGAAPAFVVREPTLLVPALVAAAAAIGAGIASWRAGLKGMWRLAGALLLLAASEVLTAAAPEARFGSGIVAEFAYAAHAAKAIGFLIFAAWLWTSVRSSIRTRYVASFAALLVATVLALSSALTGVISDNVEELELERLGSQLTNVVDGLEAGDTTDLRGDVQQIATSLADQIAVARGPQARTLAAGLVGERLLNIDFAMLLRPDGDVLGYAGRGPARFDDAGGVSETRLGQAEALSISGSRVIQDVCRGCAGGGGDLSPVSASIERIDENSVAVIAAGQIAAPGARRSSAIVAIGRYLDASTVERISSATVPGAATLFVGGKVAASTLVGDLETRFRVPREVRDDLAAVDQPLSRPVTIGTRPYFASFLPLRTANGEPTQAVMALSSSAEVISNARAGVTRSLFLVAIGVGIVVLVLAWLSGRMITRPIQSLTDTARSVREGDLTAQTRVGGDDEVGQLGVTFNQMAASPLGMTNDLREAALQEHDLCSRLETIIEAMADGLVAVDAERRIVALNPKAEELTGVDVDEALGREVEDIVDARDADGRKVSLPIFELGEGAVTGVFLARGDADLVPVAVDSAIIRGPEEEVAGAVALVRDVTREHEVERMKSEFLSNISHELRTPLTPIKGYAEMLGRKDLPPDKAEGFSSGILESTARLERIIQLLVDFSAMEAGRLAPKSNPVDISSLVEALGREWRGRTDRHEVEVDVGERLGVVGDERLLRRSLEEVLDNAVKFSPSGGTIRLQARRATGNGTRVGRVVEVSITDEGIGIPEEQIG